MKPVHGCDYFLPSDDSSLSLSLSLSLWLQMSEAKNAKLGDLLAAKGAKLRDQMMTQAVEKRNNIKAALLVYFKDKLSSSWPVHADQKETYIEVAIKEVEDIIGVSLHAETDAERDDNIAVVREVAKEQGARAGVWGVEHAHLNGSSTWEWKWVRLIVSSI